VVEEPDVGRWLDARLVDELAWVASAPAAADPELKDGVDEAERVERRLGGDAAPALGADQALDILGRDLDERHVAKGGRKVRAQGGAVGGQGGGPPAEAVEVLDQALACFRDRDASGKDCSASAAVIRRRSSRSACARVMPPRVPGRRTGPSLRLTRRPSACQRPYQLPARL
jgi:hypothetical protein